MTTLTSFKTSENWEELTGVSSVVGEYKIQNRGSKEIYVYEGEVPNDEDSLILINLRYQGVDSVFNIQVEDASKKIWVKSPSGVSRIAIKTIPSTTLYSPISYEDAITKGLVDGVEALDKYGSNEQITPSTDPEDIIQQGGRIQYDDNGTAPIRYISSSDALDVGQTISVPGLDIDGNEVKQNAITDGQNNVLLTTPLWRQNRMENNSDENLPLNGILYCHTDPTPTNGVPATIAIRTIITQGKEQTLFAGYTVPAGKVAFLKRGEIGIGLEGGASSLSEYAVCHYESRRYGKLFKVKKEFSLMVGGNNIYTDKRVFADVIPALTDIRLTVDIVSAEMRSWGTFDLELVDEEKIPVEYLQKIGQPGY